MMKESRSLFFIQVAAGIVALSLVALLLVPGKYLFVRPFTEDGFYSLTVAKNIAEGKGITIDGAALTNGFQPLFTLICVIPFVISSGDHTTAFQLLYLIHILTFVATAVVVALCVRDTISEKRDAATVWVTAFVYGSSLYIFLMHVNALETGFLMLMYALTWRFIQTRFNGTMMSFVLLGILFGLLVLTRIDAGLFCAFFALMYSLRHRREGLFQSIKGISISAGVATMISAPWWIYNVRYFGSPVPTSGLAQQQFLVSFERIEQALRAVLQNIVPFIYAARYEHWLVDIIKLAAAATIIAILHTKKKLALDRDSSFLFALASSVVFLALWYSFSSYATFFYERYLFPVAMFSTAYAAKFLLSINRTGLRTVMIVAVVVPLAGWQVRGYTGPSYGSLEHFYLETNPKYRLVKSAVPEQEKISSGQSGFLGFMRDRTVNLDGKVNGDVLPYQDSMWAYLARQDIRWMCDTKEYVTRYLSHDPSRYGWFLAAKEDGAFLYKRVQ